MPAIMIKCPNTGKAVPTGMAADEKTWQDPTNIFRRNSFRCPACQQKHTWDKKDAFLASE
jgi:endogenous inhibitor of DNA gyrase (YacG/DUF329 family)